MKEKIKPLLICIIFTIIQSILYFLGKLSPLNAHIIGGSLDNKIPFVSYFIYFYVSWYLLLFLIPYILYFKDKKTLSKYIIVTFISCVVSLFIYIFYPTIMIRPDINISGLTGFVVRFIYWVDTPNLNCFPSMHCVICFFYIYIMLFQKNIKIIYRFLIIIWSILIILSTLFVKQHVILDVISAFIISFVLYYFIPKLKIIKKYIEKGF